MLYEDIQYIIDNMSVDYSIKIELSTCALLKDSLPSDEKNSELSHPDLGSGSNKKNSELSHTNTSKSGVNISPASRPLIPRTNSTYDHIYFRNKTLDQYPTLYREFSSKNFDYYGITDETSCPLCSLDHDDEKSIEGMYKSGSYFIKCEQHKIEITA